MYIKLLIKYRIQLHIHQGDQGIIEIVIERPPEFEKFSGVRSYTPLELAVRLKMIVASGKSFLHNPSERLTALLDSSYNAKIVTVEIPRK